MLSWRDLLRGSAMSLVAFADAVWRERGVSHREAVTWTEESVSGDESAIFSAHGLSWVAACETGKRRDKAPCRQSRRSLCLQIDSHRKGVCAEPRGPYIRWATPRMTGVKRPGLRLIWIAFCCVVLTKLLNNIKCPQQYCHPSVHRLNVAFCLCACYGEKYFTSSSKCRRLQLKAKRSLPSNSNYEHEKSHYVYLQALI